MEKTVAILSKSELRNREWTNQNGEKKSITSIELVMTDGVDTLVAEATDSLAAKIAAKDFGLQVYRCQFKMSVRETENKDTHKKYAFNSIRLLAIGGF